jgi:hypothetical protein
MKEFRELKKALLASEYANNQMVDAIVSIIRQSRQVDASADDILTRLYREVLVPQGVDSDNTVF